MRNTFQIGDLVTIARVKGTIIKSKNDDDYLVHLETDDLCWYTEDDFDESYSKTSPKISHKRTMSTINKLTILAKSIVDSDLKNMIKVGWLDSSLQLTQEGEEAILAHYLSANKADLGKLAEAELKERRKDRKGEE